MFEKFTGKIVKHIHQNGRNYLTAGAVIFAGVEGIWAYKAGKKEGEKPSKTPQEFFKRLIGPVVCFAGAAGCAVGANVEAGAQIGTLIAANMMDKKKRQDLVQEVKDAVGEEKLNDIKRKLHGDEIVDPKELNEHQAKGLMLFVDDITGARRWTTKEDILERAFNLNALLDCTGPGHFSWHMALRKLGFKENEIPTEPVFSAADGTQVTVHDIGVNAAGLVEDYETQWFWVRLIDSTDVNGNPYVLIDLPIEPWVGYLDYE